MSNLLSSKIPSQSSSQNLQPIETPDKKILEIAHKLWLAIVVGLAVLNALPISLSIYGCVKSALAISKIKFPYAVYQFKDGYWFVEFIRNMGNGNSIIGPRIRPLLPFEIEQYKIKTKHIVFLVLSIVALSLIATLLVPFSSLFAYSTQPHIETIVKSGPSEDIEGRSGTSYNFKFVNTKVESYDLSSKKNMPNNHSQTIHKSFLLKIAEKFNKTSEMPLIHS